jgi:hypothetical protein
MSEQATPQAPAAQPAEKDPVVIRAAAEAEYARILGCFDVEKKTDTDAETIIRAIMAGRIILDEGKEELTYKLARPIELMNNSGIIEQIVFHEPTNTELEYINRGTKVQMNVEGEKMANMDMGDTFMKTTRFLTKVCNLPLGVAGRLKARDASVVKAICDFFA